MASADLSIAAEQARAKAGDESLTAGEKERWMAIAGELDRTREALDSIARAAELRRQRNGF